MKITHLTFTALLALTLLFAEATTHFAQAPATETARGLRKDEAVAQLRSDGSQRAIVEVSFAEGVPASTLRKQISQTHLDAFRVVYQWGNHRGGYGATEGQTLQEFLTDFESRHLQFLQRHIKNLSVDSRDLLQQRGVNANTIAEMERSRQQLLDEFTTQLTEFHQNGLVISGLVAEDTQEKLVNFVQTLSVDHARFQINPNANVTQATKSSASRAAASRSGISANGAKDPFPNNPWVFAPSHGRVVYDKDQKILSSYFSWDDMSGFILTHIGYEHDIVIFDTTYVEPKVGVEWHSNMPHDPNPHSNDSTLYPENNIGDNAPLFSIGTGAAQKIRVGLLYYTEIPVTVKRENGGPSNATVEPQLGSWAGEFDDDADNFNEAAEILGCETLRVTMPWQNDFGQCIFPDQRHRIINYFNESGAFVDFLFDHRVSSTYHWDKAFASTPPDLSCPEGTYKADYWKWVTEDGQRKKKFLMRRCEQSPINYDWGTGAPDISNQTDDLEFEWTGRFNFAEGQHRFIASSDDGMQVFIDDNLVIDGWRDRSETEDRVDRFMTGGVHTVRVKYYEHTGDAVARFRWEPVTGNPCQASVANDRWRGEYFNNRNLSGSPVMVRDDSDQNGGTFFAHDWGLGSPNSGCGVSADNFSARWTRSQQFTDGRYRFTLRADDGVRLYVDNVLRIDQWRDQGATNYTVDLDLTMGSHALRVEYYENGGLAVAQVFWQRMDGNSATGCQASVPLDAWRGEYFNNRDLSGSPVMVRDDTSANNSNFFAHDWGLGSPNADCGVPADNFSARWTRRQQFDAGRYSFTVRADDGTRFYIDGVRHIDQWRDQGATNYTVEVVLTAGNHDLRVEYYENGGLAVAQIFWQRVDANTGCQASVAPDRWRGEYFNNRDLTGAPVMTRDDSDPNGGTLFAHNWGNGSPNAACGVPSDNFSARWIRRQNFDAGRYSFTVRADDGVRFYVDGVLRVDQWRDQGATSYTVTLDLTGGGHDLKMEYYEHGGDAVAQIHWERAGGNALPTVTRFNLNSTPINGLPFGGTIIGTGFVPNSTQVWFCPVNNNNCSQHPPAGVVVNDPTGVTVENVRLSTGSWQVFVETPAGPSGRSAAFSVQAAPASCVAAVNADRWKGEYFNNRDMSGTPVMVRDDSDVNGGPFFAHDWGTGSPNAGCGVASDNFSVRWNRRQQFESGRYSFTLRADDGVRFYVDGVRHIDQWRDQGATNYTVQLDLATGAHDLRVEYYENGGFAVAQIFWERIGGGAIPTVGNFNWNPATPIANQNFGGSVTGTNFVIGATEVWFCPINSASCLQHPSNGVTVNSGSTLTLVNVRLAAGTWQFFVKTAAGQSGRSNSFNVQTSGAPPTIGNFSWNPSTPAANQNFGGSVTGTNFVTGNGATEVWFCPVNSNNCNQHPPAGVTVNNAGSLSVVNVRLSTGSWQFFVKTAFGQSSRSSSFNVQPGAPTIGNFSWNPSTPTANQNFGGSVTGTNFVTGSGATEVWFCPVNSNTCFQHPPAGVTVDSNIKLTVVNVRLGNGLWQFFLKTAAGQSGRSGSFSVQ